MEELPICEFSPYAEFHEFAGWSRDVKIKAGWVCEFPNCGQINKNLLESHHIEPAVQFPEKAQDIDNGTCLCIYHHAVAHWDDVIIRNMILARLAIFYHLRYEETDKKAAQS